MHQSFAASSLLFRKVCNLLFAAALLTVALGLQQAPLAHAETPTGFQEYFVLGFEQHVWDMMDKVERGEGGGPFAYGMNSVVTAAAPADNQVIYYDHWEDGFEADIFNPVQLSTLIIGDGNAANGDACDFNSDPCGVDVLLRGDFVNFASNQGIMAGCTVPSASPLVFTELCSSAPVYPRCDTLGACTAAELRFDGGDLVTSTGGPLAIVHSQNPLTQFIGGSTEMLSRQAVEAARSYSVPVGEDLYPAFGCPNCVMEPFHYVDLNLVAFEDNTQVFVNSPGAGTVSFTLNRGEHWSSLGFIDDNPFDPTLFLTINAGAKVSTTGPIAGLLFTGGDGTWATRHYALLPDILHSTDYVITAPGDDPAVTGSTPNRPLNIYLFNPDPLNAVSVTATDTVGTTIIDVPANSVVDYFTGVGRFVPNGSTVRMTSDRNFWGLSAYDYNTNIGDWGHSWLATKFLTPNYTVSFAPGTLNPPVDQVNLNAVFIAATADNTRVQVDFDNDGVFDVVDLDGDGVPDAAPLPGNTYLVSSLGALRVFDPNDFDNTGARVIANKPVAVAYGQDNDLTDFGGTDLDTGFTVYPPNQLFLEPALVLIKSVDTPVAPTAGGTATYILEVSAFDFGPITNLVAYDLLPPGVTGADYVPGSTLVTYPNLAQNTIDPVASIDPGTGRYRLDWTLSPDTLQADQTLTIRYSVAIPPAPGGTPRVLTNEAHAEGNLGASVFAPFDVADVVQSDLALTKSVSDDGTPEPGDVLTYILAVSNNGLAPETNVIITDAIPPNTTILAGSITSSGPFAGIYSAAQNAVVWTAASFPVGGPHTLTFQVVINPGVPAATTIANSAAYESVETPLFPSNEVAIVTVGPLLVVAKSGPALLHPNELASFEIQVENMGSRAATNVRIVDPFPTNTAYIAESMEWRRNVSPFVEVTDAPDADEGTAFVDRLELLVASLGPGEDLTFRFEVQATPRTGGLFVNNQAWVVSDKTPPTDTNLVQTPIVGRSDVTGHVFLDENGNGVQDPGEPNLANVAVMVTDSTGATQTVYTDAHGDYLATADMACYEDAFAAVAYNGSDGQLDWSGAGDEWTELTDQGDADQDPTTPTMWVTADPLAVFHNSLVIEDGPGGTPAKGFTRQVHLSAGQGFAEGFATLSLNYRREALEGSDVVTLDIDYDNDGTFNDVVGIFNTPGGDDAAWQSASFVLDSSQLPGDPAVIRFITTGGFSAGTDNFYVDNVRACNTAVTVNVDETDPDFPAGPTLTTANDPQVVAAVSGGTIATAPVGYQRPHIALSKQSDAPNYGVFPGQIITYTLGVMNNTMVTQTGIDLDDALPAGATYVPGSTLVQQQVFRVNEYFIVATDFTGNAFDLMLNQNLAPDYFVIVQGSDGTGAGNGNCGPDENYAALTADPFGTGELEVSSAADVVRLERNNSVNGWQGVVTVVECVRDCATNGFVLRDVRRVDHAGAATSGAEATANPWMDINQTMLLGGFNGAGCYTAEADVADTKVCHVRLFPSAPDQINWTRDAGGATLSAATSTVMVVEWGASWTVQRARVQGSNGGDGADAAGEYNTAAISPVARADTWVWGAGHTNDNGIGDAAEAVLLTLGDGVNQNATESLVAAGVEFADNALDFEVYALTHPDLSVDYVFKADGDTGSLTVDVAAATAIHNRMALAYNGLNGTGNSYPRPMFSARYTGDNTVRLERRRSGQPFLAWVQGIDFSTIIIDVVGGAPPDLVAPANGFTIAPAATFRVTFQVTVNDPLAPAITQIQNTAMLNTDQAGPLSASVTDDVIRPAVTVEPNNAGFAVADGTDRTVTYTHQVVNSGDVDDSYAITVVSELGYPVELIHAATGVVIATDSDGDGVWDGGVEINTGPLAPGQFVTYGVRITVPAGAPIGAQETTQLMLSSPLVPGRVYFAADETIVVDPGHTNAVMMGHGQSSIVTAGASVVYPFTVWNLTGVPDKFTIKWFDSVTPGWSVEFYDDSNGNGLYDPRVDQQITQTRQMTDGGSTRVFVLVTAPGAASVGDTEAAKIVAFSGNDPDNYGIATATTTVRHGSMGFDLSGGGTQYTDPGDTRVYPGTLWNLGNSSDRYDFTLTASPFLGLDGLLHPTQLVVDTDADGVPDTQIAEDADGDGAWDTIAPGFDTDTDSNPDVFVPAGGNVAYEVRRPVDPMQLAFADYVTLTAHAQSTGDVDSVTPATILVAATAVGRYSISGTVTDGANPIEGVDMLGTSQVLDTTDASGYYESGAVLGSTETIHPSKPGYGNWTPPSVTFTLMTSHQTANFVGTNDADGDGVGGDVDNCPNSANPNQEDADGDGQGDACDACPNDPDNDVDGDGVCGDGDNCPNDANPGQEDADQDGEGDACDPCTDADGDGYGVGRDCTGPDCDDTNPSVNPGATESCTDEVDNDCDELVDDGDPDCPPPVSGTAVSANGLELPSWVGLVTLAVLAVLGVALLRRRRG